MEIIKNNALKENILDIKIDSSTNLSTLVSTILLATHPVGSLYWSSDSTDPGTLFGGTWTPITDTYIVAAGSSFVVGNSYGALTHNHNIEHTHGVPGVSHYHSTNNHTLTAAESGLPSHNHEIQREQSSKASGGNWDWGGPGGYDSGIHSYTTSTGGWSASSGHNHGNTGATTPGSTTTNSQSVSTSGDASSLPPSEARYCWERTA